MLKWCLGICGCVSLGILQAGEGDRAAAPELKVIFTHATPKLEEEARWIIGGTAERFEQVTHESIGNVTIRVEVVDDSGALDEGFSPAGKIQGMTVFHHGSNLGAIRISSQRSVGFGRILAHEVTHVFVREVFGRVRNRVLNEGLAEYLASLQFPSEVKRDLRSAASSSSASLRQYVDGYRFCEQFAGDERFPGFLKREINRNLGNYEELKAQWDHESGTGSVK